MNLNLSQFKKIKEDQKTATLRHPKGHEFTIAKSALSPQMKKELSGLPVHLDEGGVVAREDAPPKDVMPAEAQSEMTAQAQPQAQPQTMPTIIINNGQPQGQQAQPPPPPQQPEMSGAQKVGQYLGQGVRNDLGYLYNAARMVTDPIYHAGKGVLQGISGEQPQAPAPAGNAEPAPLMQKASMEEAAPQMQMPTGQNSGLGMGQQDPYGTQAYLDSYQSGLQQQKAGLAQEAQATGQQGQESAALLNQSVQNQQAQMKTYQDHFSELDAERKAFQSDLQNKHIDPQHYLNSMGTAQRVSTGIGLILGGLGAGLLHHENPVLKMLQQNIDRDVDAQKAEIGKSENLLSANMRQFGNLKDATDMTRVMQMDIVGNQLKEAAAKTQDPLAKARALQAAGQLEMQSAPIMSQLAARRTLMSGMQTGRLDPSMTVRMIVPEGQQAAAFKELQSAENMSHQRDNLLGAFDQLNKTNTLSNRLTSPFQTSKQVDAVREPLLAQLVKDAEGRITPTDVEMLRGLFPATGDNEQTVQIKKAQMRKFIDEKMNFPLLNGYGIHMGGGAGASRYGASGEKKIQLGPPQVAGAK